MSQTAENRTATKEGAAFVQKWLGNPVTRRSMGRDQVLMVVGVDVAAKRVCLGCGTWLNVDGVDLWPPGADS